MKSLTYYFDTPATRKLCDIYGAKLDGMDDTAQAALLALVSRCIYYLSFDITEEGLGTFGDELATGEYEILTDDEDLMACLEALDKESHDPHSLVRLAEGLTNTLYGAMHHAA